MEGIIVKLLGKYLSLFINNFSKENFNISITKGQGEYRNLDLNTEVIQELLWIPTNLTVTRAICNHLSIQVALTKLKTQPIVITLDKVEFFLREPEDIKAMPNLLQKFKKSGSSNPGQSEIMMGVTIEIKEISMKIETLPPVHLPTWSPIMEINLRNIQVHSTNEKGEIVELPKTRVIDPKDPTSLYMYKSVKVETATAWIVAQNGQKITIIEQSPITAMLKSKWGVKEGNWMGGENQIVYQDLKFKVNLEQYSFLSFFIESMKAAFARPVPEPANQSIEPAPSAATLIVKETAPATASVSDEYDTSLEFLIKNWHFELDSQSKGARLNGNQFSVHLQSSRKRNPKTQKAEYNTILCLSTPSLKLTSLDNNQETILLETIDSSDASEGLKRLFSVDFQWTTQPLELKTDSEKSPLGFRTKELISKVKLSGLQIFLEGSKWDSTWAFLIDRIHKETKGEDEEKGKEGEEKKEDNEPDKKLEMVKQQLKELRDLNDLKLTIEASKVILVVPPSKSAIVLPFKSLASEYENRGMKFSFGRIYLSNNPSWNSIPIIESEGDKLFRRGKDQKEEEEEREEQKLVLQNLQRFSLNHSTLNRKTVQSDPLQLLGGDSEGSHVPPPVPRRPSKAANPTNSAPISTPSNTNTNANTNNEVESKENAASLMPPVPHRPPPAGRERSGSGGVVDVLPASYVPTAQNAIEHIETITSKILGDSVYKFEFDFTDMLVEFIEIGKNGSIVIRENLFHGDGLQLFARYSPSHNQKNSSVEFVFVGLNEILLNLTIEQLFHTSQLLQRFYYRASGSDLPPKLKSPTMKSPPQDKKEEENGKKEGEKAEEKSENESGEKSKIDVEKMVESTLDKLKKKIDEGIGKIDSVDINKIDDFVDEKYINSAGLFLRNVMQKSKEIMESAQFTFFVRIHKVHFHVPLDAFEGLDDPVTYENQFIDEEKRIQMAKISSFGFDFIDFGVQYTPKRQAFVLRQNGLMTKDWNPSFLSSSLTVTPSPLNSYHPSKAYRLNTSEDFNCLFQIERRTSSNNEKRPEIQALIQLRDMHIYLQDKSKKEESVEGNGKKLLTSENISSATNAVRTRANSLKDKAITLNNQYKESQLNLPDLQKIIQDGVNFFEERRAHFMDKFEQVKGKVQEKGTSLTDELAQFNFAGGQRSEIKWEMEVSDCEFRMISGDIDAKPNAAIKISNRKQKKSMIDKYVDLEQRLALTEKKLVETQIKSVQLQEYEEKFTEAKIECSKWQMDFMDLQRDFENLKLKLSTPQQQPPQSPARGFSNPFGK
eukprot:TRINITY_DN3186_c0_g1_i2.p1 TRINITY_DN3186_c0_g1~~TRINITY_DN3186_c0_g1_i2.p1  ORF type:complete len:1283 (-),score=545.90 TRINITY_DN3186_c0_g1_i2:43-3891(-)